MEINDYSSTKQNRIYKTAVSEYESSYERVKYAKSLGQDDKQASVINQEGKILKGEVVDLRYQEIKIRLEPSGQVITGKISGDVPLYIGQTAEFEISDRTGDVITLRLLPMGSSPMNDIIHKALSSSGLALSEKNMAIVQELLNFGMPVDKKTLLQMIKLTGSYPDTTIKNLVLMLKNHLPINPVSIAQLESYQKGTHQILNELNNLIGHISNALKDLASESNTQNAMTSKTLEDNLLTNLENSGDISENNIQSDTEISLYAENAIEKLITYDNAGKSDDVLLGIKNLLSILRDGEDTGKQYTPDMSINQILSEDNIKSIQDSIIKLNQENQPPNSALNTFGNSIKDGTVTIKDLLTYTFDIYKNGQADYLKENALLPPRLFEAYIGISDSLTPSEKEQLMHVLKDNYYEKFLKDEFHNRWTLNTGKLKDNIISKKFFRRLYEDLERLKNLSDNNKLFESQPIRTSIEKLQDNLQFMRDLNELFMYLQLPMRLTNQDAHGDLYVFTRKYKGSQNTNDSNQVSALLHLNMKNLGTIDIHLTLKKQLVNAIFYLEKSSEQLISGHIHMLVDALNNKGYQLQVKTHVSESKPDYINDLLNQGSNLSKSISRFSFDIRA